METKADYIEEFLELEEEKRQQENIDRKIKDLAEDYDRFVLKAEIDLINELKTPETESLLYHFLRELKNLYDGKNLFKRI